MLILLSLLLLAAAPQDAAAAPVAPPAAPAATCDLPADLAGWSADTKSTDRAVGKTYFATRFVPNNSQIANLPAEAIAQNGRAIMSPIGFPTGGTFQIAVSAGTYIGLLVQGHIPVQSDGDRPAFACAGIAKITTFTVPQGQYILVISGIPDTDGVRVLMAPVH